MLKQVNGQSWTCTDEHFGTLNLDQIWIAQAGIAAARYKSVPTVESVGWHRVLQVVADPGNSQRTALDMTVAIAEPLNPSKRRASETLSAQRQ